MKRTDTFLLLAVMLVACGRDRPAPNNSDGGTDTPRERTSMGCLPNVIDPFPTPECSAATGRCVHACTNVDCLLNCLDADPNGDCVSCTDDNLLSCVNSMGCQDAFDEQSCCIETNCPDRSCFETTCGEATRGYYDCTSGVGARCAPSIEPCFASE